MHHQKIKKRRNTWKVLFLALGIGGVLGYFALYLMD